MITTSDKVYITQEIAKIVLKHVEEKALRPLLLKFSYGEFPSQKKITNLIQDIGYENGVIVSPNNQLELSNFIDSFLKQLDKEVIYSLHFWTLCRNDEMYLSRFENNESEDLDESFGRSLQEKLSNPKETGLSSDLFDALEEVLTLFATETDFSEIDEDTVMFLDETIEGYCFW